MYQVNAEILKALLDQRDINLSATDSDSKLTALHVVVIKMGETSNEGLQKEIEKCLDLLLESPLCINNVDFRNKNGETALHLAAHFGESLYKE